MRVEEKVLVETMSAPGAEIGEVNVADHVRLRQDQEIVVAAQVARPIGEALAAEPRLVELEILDLGAHRAVEHENALAREIAQRGFDG